MSEAMSSAAQATPAVPRADIQALTGLRGLAALYVAAYHTFPPARLQTPWVAALFGRGYLAVDLFFVLSGFVVALGYGNQFAGGLSLRAGVHFLTRRVARVFPLYLAVLLARFAYSLAAYGSLHVPRSEAAVSLSPATPWRDVLANLSLVQSWGVARSIIGQGWSVSVEWAVYFAFPLLAVAGLFRGGRSPWVLAGVAVACILLVAGLDITDGAYHSGALDAYDGRAITPLLRCLGGFTLGVLTLRAWRHPPAARVAARDLSGVGVTAWFVAGLLLGLPDLALYPAFPLLVLCLASNRGRFGAAFACRPVVGLGALSYAIYLLHAFLVRPLQALQDRLDWTLSPPLSLAVCLALMLCFLPLVAWPAHVGVERPGRRLVRVLPRLAGAG